MGALLNPRVAPLHTSTVSAFTDYYRCYRSKVCGTAVCSSTTDRWQRSGTFLRGQGRGRFLILDFNRISGVEVWQIGNEGGFLAAPVNLRRTGIAYCWLLPSEQTSSSTSPTSPLVITCSATSGRTSRSAAASLELISTSPIQR